MVIQRWQSVFLLLAGLAMCFFAFSPVCELTNPDELIIVKSINILPVFILALLSGLLLFISIFMFKCTRLQKRIVIASEILTIFTDIALITYYLTSEAMSFAWCFAAVLPFIALVLEVMAYIRIRKDENLLRSYDRIR